MLANRDDTCFNIGAATATDGNGATHLRKYEMIYRYMILGALAPFPLVAIVNQIKKQGAEHRTNIFSYWYATT